LNVLYSQDASCHEYLSSLVPASQDHSVLSHETGRGCAGMSLYPVTYCATSLQLRGLFQADVAPCSLSASEVTRSVRRTIFLLFPKLGYDPYSGQKLSAGIVEDGRDTNEVQRVWLQVHGWCSGNSEPKTPTASHCMRANMEATNATLSLSSTYCLLSATIKMTQTVERSQHRRILRRVTLSVSKILLRDGILTADPCHSRSQLATGNM
jgi:hypothetical protein